MSTRQSIQKSNMSPDIEPTLPPEAKSVIRFLQWLAVGLVVLLVILDEWWKGPTPNQNTLIIVLTNAVELIIGALVGVISIRAASKSRD